MSCKIAIIGRPNVGKSTLFNRLVGQKIALVDDSPGVTRDRRVHAARLQDLRFDVIDTAGLELGKGDSLAARMRLQTQHAVEEADLLLFLFDSRMGINAVDEEFAKLIRQSGKATIVVANKTENRAAIEQAYEAWRLGLGDAIYISAEHGLGLSDLRDAVFAHLGSKCLASKIDEKAANAIADESYSRLGQASAINDSSLEAAANLQEAELDEDSEVVSIDRTKPLRVAIVGRPNVGKSTFINGLLGEERLLTGPEAGLTRDSISVEWQWRDRKIKLFDTAGLRKRARVQQKLEKLSVGDSLRAIRFAEVVVVMLDATIPFEKQDLQIIDLVIREGRALVLAFNKWDMVKDPSVLLKELHEKTARLLPQVKGLRAVPISGAQARGVDKLMENIEFVYEIWNKRVSTARLNNWLADVVAHHPPPAISGRRLKLKYISQIKTRPPSFMLACSRSDMMPQSYIRYLINGLRAQFGFVGVPIRFNLRSAENPFADK